MPELTPEERSMRARMGAHALHASHDPRKTTEKGRRKFLDRFEKEVDPDGVLAPDERARRAGHARKLYFTRLAYASAKARRKGSAA